ncbi:MAG: DUF3833 domain-containing protein [Rhodoferax sp.]|uniref:DUF3833 domain-containing protein n=1 Tax=Rhodoferax sp. TaxID=50421 RepID=UPI002719F8C8|nr:DUF3833 domain-containing protein [Rhodoferax sp.]MDO8447282.1 DUF3833 domain-containing protein [Rhodoferax sp.]
MTRRRILVAAAIATSALILGGCASQQIDAYATEKPVLDLQQYFNGTLDAYGVFTDRSGTVVKRFTVVMICNWNGAQGVLDETFTYADGSTQKRIWKLQKQADGRFTGRADDVVGEALGESRGNAFHWAYTLRLPVDGKVYEVQFDDWMYLMTDKVMLNKAAMSKFGVRLGEVTLSFVKR